jgi:nucleotide-binding universal stress UspA family protein
MFERILVPLDGSRRAEAILRPLDWLATSPASEILLTRACPLRPVGAFEAVALMPADVEEARGYLERVAADLRAQGRRVRTLLREGPAAEAILDAAAEEKATLVVLSTHGRTGFSRFVFGSVTEKVLRASPTPVMVFPAFAPFRPEAPRQILVPLESDETASSVVPLVTDLARATKARVLLLHAGKEASFLQSAAASLAAEGVEGAAHVVHGEPAAGILETASDCGADLLVMATHGRRAPSRWVFGSVTEKVLRAATSPLLVVRMAPIPKAVATAEASDWKE